MTGIGTITAAEVFSERVELQPRTSDPSNTEEGEGWVRSDVAPETDQIGTLRFDTGSGTIDLPIFDTAATVGSDIETHLRVPVGGAQGFVPTTNDGAAYPAVGVWDSGARFGAHDSLSALPDSGLLHDYDPTKLSLSDGNTVNTRTNQATTGDDLAVTGDPKYDVDGINGKAAVIYDSNDYHQGAFTADVSPPFETFHVFQLDTIDASDTLQSGQSSTADWIVTGSGNYAAFDGTHESTKTTTDEKNLKPRLGVVRWASDGEIQLESTVEGTGDLSDSTISGLTIGAEFDGGNPATFRSGQFMVYDPTVSGYSRTDVVSYLTNKYGPFN